MTPPEHTDRIPLLLELERDTHVDPEALARVRERVTSSLTDATLAALGEQARLPQRRLRVPGGRTARASWSGLVIALGVGTALGAGGHALVSSQLRDVQPTPGVVKRALQPQPALPRGSAVAQAPEMPAPVAPIDEATPPPAVEPRRASAAPAATPAAEGQDDQLNRELRELDRARSAVAHGQPAVALAILEAQSRLYPSSMLSQEREALTIKALVGAGRHAEARTAGERFRTRYPNGLLLDTVNAALATIP